MIENKSRGSQGSRRNKGKGKGPQGKRGNEVSYSGQKCSKGPNILRGISLNFEGE